MNVEQFKIEINNNFGSVNDEFFNKIEIYKNFLIEQNKKFNLTRLDGENKIYGEYFFESIIPYKTINFQERSKILDIGSGSGIPGLVLKLLFPNIELTIIESSQKKCIFLQQLIDLLKLNNVIVLNKRAESISKDEYETFDVVTSRAVAKLRYILELSTPYCKVNGLVIQPKSQKYETELDDSKYMISKLDLHLTKVNTFISPNNITHNILIFTKKKQTNRTYPRE
jgi:16S rRNA (guanine527-N7)-methyltransferase